MKDATTFGGRLRDLRHARGVSQADLAGGDLSASYISLLESGRRKPSAPLLQLLADRLGVAKDELTGAAAHERHVTSSVEHFALARQAWRDGDTARAESLLADTATQAHAVGDSATWWTASRELAELLHGQQRYPEAQRLLEKLATAPKTLSSDWLGVDVGTALAESLRAMGKLDMSIEAAGAAAALSRKLVNGSAERARALIALIAAEAEAGDLAAAARTSDDLAAVIDDVTSPKLLGATYWALGNQAFLRGLTEEGAAFHDQALQIVSPRADLRFWARLHRASASMRLAADTLLDTVGPLLARARVALELVGSPTDLAELAATESMHEWRRGRPAEALRLSATALAAPSALAPQQRGATLLVRARALRALGDDAAARSAYRDAAEAFDVARAYRRASTTWRELHDAFGEVAGADVVAPDAKPHGPW